MAKITQTELSRRLNKNGWSWFLISNLTPGVIRIQLGASGNEETGWRKCVEAPSLEEAVVKAEQFIETNSVFDYVQSLFA